MVNSGGPSKGCRTCIRRKIRCDRQKPFCSQCQRARRQCEGYRDPTDIMFRDQSQSVMKRAREGRDAKDVHIRAQEHQPSSFAAESAIVLSPKMNEDQGVISFFATNFMGHDNLFIAPDDLNQSLKFALVNYSLQAVGAMALAFPRRDSYYHRKAQERYGAALLMLTEAWRQDCGIEQDYVLLSVLFLSFFEILASFNTFHKSWLAHLNGLGGLLQLRQRKGVRTSFGFRVSVQAQSQMIHNALRTKTAVPREVVENCQRIHVSIEHQPAEALNALLIRLATLQASYSPVDLSKDVFSDLVALDYDISQWADNILPSWTFSMQPSGYHSGLWWDVRHDIYSSRLMMYTWNKARAARLIIHDLILEHLSAVDVDEVGLVTSSQHHEDMSPTVQQLIIDICATVPLFYRPLPNIVGHDLRVAQDIGSVYWLLWALEVVGSRKEAPTELVQWILQCLDRIYETTGVVKAQSAAQRLRSGHNNPGELYQV